MRRGAHLLACYKYVRDNPGASTRAVARALGVADSTADYHLRRLMQRKLILRQSVGRVAAHYANGCSLTSRERRLAGLNPTGRRAVELLRSAGVPMRPSQVASRIGEPLVAVRWSLAQGVKLGLLQRFGYGAYEVVA